MVEAGHPVCHHTAAILAVFPDQLRVGLAHSQDHTVQPFGGTGIVAVPWGVGVVGARAAFDHILAVLEDVVELFFAHQPDQ